MMRVTAAIAPYLPRFALAVLAVPAAFVMVALAASSCGAEPGRTGAGAGALTFALVFLAPSTSNAAWRAGVTCAAAAIFCAAALLAQ